MIWLVFGIAFGIGLAIPPDILDGMVGTLIITFFGLLAAGFVPAITLLVSTSFSGKYSIQALRKAKTETEGLVKSIMSTLMFILFGGIFSIIASIITPNSYEIVIRNYNFVYILDRIAQALVVACFIVALDRMRLMKVAFERVLEENYRAAKDANTSRIDNNISSAKVKSAFKRSSNFGRVVKRETSERQGNGK